MGRWTEAVLLEHGLWLGGSVVMCMTVINAQPIPALVAVCIAVQLVEIYEGCICRLPFPPLRTHLAGICAGCRQQGKQLAFVVCKQ